MTGASTGSRAAGPASPGHGGRRVTHHRRQRGILLPAVVFVMVVVGGLIATMALMTQRSAGAIVAEVAGVRALAAAQAGADWAAWQVRDPTGTLSPGTTAVPACPASPTTLSLPAPLDAYTVSVTCARTPATGEVDEGGLRSAFYEITATASSGSVGSADRIERRVQLRLETCKSAGGLAPAFAC